MKLSLGFFMGCVLLCSTNDAKHTEFGFGEIDSSPIFSSLSLFKSIEFNPGDNTEKEIKIGLLTSKKATGDKISLAAQQGAQLAITEANKRGGYKGRQFRLVSRSCEGPWGSGINAATDLVFRDNVWAILGSLDGRNAHLAEQVITKSKIVLLCSRATDPTLSKIYIPWFFRCIPDDEQLALALVNEIIKERKTEKVAIVAAENYDGQMAADSFSKIAEKEGFPIHSSFSFVESKRDFQALIHKISKSDVKGIILFGPSSSVKKIIRQMRKDGLTHRIFVVLSDDRLGDLDISENGKTDIISSNFKETFPGKKFVAKFQKTYGHAPNTTAAYAFDGMNLLIEVIKKAGLDREKIKNVLAQTDYSNGVTGPIRFEKNGNRVSHSNLIRIGKQASER